MIPTLISVTPSGLESHVKKQKTQAADVNSEEDPNPEEIGEDEETDDAAAPADVSGNRPTGNIFGTVMHRFFDMLGGKAVMEKEPKTEGRNITMVLAPAK
jgi:hypothetical protein